MKNPEFGAEYLHEIFSYDPEEGTLRWKKPTGWRAKVGALAGKVGNGKGVPYVHVRIHGRIYMAHRIIWCMMTGNWPVGTIDHEDMDASNNRWKNLREATYTQNNWNQRLKRSNTSGFKGVYFASREGKWISRIRIGAGKRLTLGYFDSAETAAAAYREAALRHHGDFARFA